jgi:hypothetical protein
MYYYYISSILDGYRMSKYNTWNPIADLVKGEKTSAIDHMAVVHVHFIGVQHSY